ncbi:MULTISPECIES: hypothetical protein [Aliarcobacter]|uniref:Uncharacterized protein n=1 Tax=Aliarcobacter cibarius TaxID=255507 RepID=A0ABY2V2C2_9BACT|nr:MULTISPECIES: hypothetical protein [Aliarcobacter]MDK2047855.1 hypothetical protein [Aliarcobacter butzleri]TLS96823.1 hypothetical protein FE247_09355 [Aliarcobacter cibarius]TLS97328.1 hypothetical protein FE245_09365 [Aliarcobacter cibarius]
MDKNPFQNTKASYFDDPEIIKFWVEPNSEENFFKTVVNPDSSIPIRILGGKGTGKTHILRYFSFNSQLLRAKENNQKILNSIMQEQYIGVYIVASGLSVNRFFGRGISEEHWKNIFYYYINLEFIEKVLKKIIVIYEESEISLKFNIPNISSFLFDRECNILELHQMIRKARVDIDKKIAKLSFPGADKTIIENIEPLFDVQDSFYNIIKVVLDSLEEIKNIKVLYIIDEFENFSAEQQKFFNTLLRHPKHIKNIAIRISGRLYANKTIETLDSEEKLLQDSEVRTIYLEDIIEKNFKDFAINLYTSRIKNTLGIDIENIDFRKNFEKSKDANLENVNRITENNKSVSNLEKKYFIKLLNNLNIYHSDKYDVEEIINNISYKENSYIEKINTFLCYQKWSDNLSIFTYEIKEKMKKKDFSLQDVASDKFMWDMIYQLFREYRLSYYYGGFDDIIKVSRNNPRVFLSILNNIFLECSLGTKLNMYTDFIPCKVQNNALLESSLWFWNNFTEDVKDHRAVWAVKELCDFFRKARQSFKPSEKTLISFAYNTNEVSREVNNLIDMAVEHSLLLESSQQRRDNSTSELKRQLRIHPLLSIKWELPISVGGTPVFTKDEVEALFLKKEEEWEIYSSERIKQLNPPFEKKKRNIKAKKIVSNDTSILDLNWD